MKSIRGAVLRKLKHPLSVENLEFPALSGAQVLVKLAYSGVCHSQIMEVEGRRGFDKWIPHLLGHEGSGFITGVGPGVSKVNVGDRVVVSWLKSSGDDAESPVYKSLENLDLVNSGKSTTFSEYTIVPENRVFKVPHNISTLEAVLFGCAIPTGAGMVLNECTPEYSQTILVYGLGGIGLSTLLTLKSLGYDDISVADIASSKLDIAKSFGIDALFNLSDPIARNNISEKNYSAIYEASGTTEGIEHAFSLLTDTGTLVFASHPESGRKISLDPHDLIRGKKILGSWGGASNPEKIIKRFSEIRESKEVNLDKFVESVYALDEINEALHDLKSGKVLRPIIAF